MLFGDAKQSVSEITRLRMCERIALAVRLECPAHSRTVKRKTTHGAKPAEGNSDLLANLSDEEADRLAAFATETSVAEGPDPDEAGGLLGRADRDRGGLRRRDPGTGKQVASLKAGDLIGEIGLFERQPRNADVIATSPMRVLKLTHWEIRRMSNETVERIRKLVEERQAAGVADPANAPADR